MEQLWRHHGAPWTYAGGTMDRPRTVYGGPWGVHGESMDGPW